MTTPTRRSSRSTTPMEKRWPTGGLWWRCQAATKAEAAAKVTGTRRSRLRGGRVRSWGERAPRRLLRMGARWVTWSGTARACGDAAEELAVELEAADDELAAVGVDGDQV